MLRSELAIDESCFSFSRPSLSPPRMLVTHEAQCKITVTTEKSPRQKRTRKSAESAAKMVRSTGSKSWGLVFSVGLRAMGVGLLRESS